MDNGEKIDQEELQRISDFTDSRLADEPALSARDQARKEGARKFIKYLEQPDDGTERSSSIRQINLRLAGGESPEVIIESFGGRESLEELIGERDLQTLINFEHQEEED